MQHPAYWLITQVFSAINQYRADYLGVRMLIFRDPLEDGQETIHLLGMLGVAVAQVAVAVNIGHYTIAMWGNVRTFALGCRGGMRLIASGEEAHKVE